MAFVLDGRLRIGELGLELGPGEVVGELGPGRARRGRGPGPSTCIEAGDVLEISYDQVRQLYFQNPAVRLQLPRARPRAGCSTRSRGRRGRRGPARRQPAGGFEIQRASSAHAGGRCERIGSRSPIRATQRHASTAPGDGEARSHLGLRARRRSRVPALPSGRLERRDGRWRPPLATAIAAPPPPASYALESTIASPGRRGGGDRRRADPGPRLRAAASTRRSPAGADDPVTTRP